MKTKILAVALSLVTSALFAQTSAIAEPMPQDIIEWLNPNGCSLKGYSFKVNLSDFSSTYKYSGEGMTSTSEAAKYTSSISSRYITFNPLIEDQWLFMESLSNRNTDPGGRYSIANSFRYAATSTANVFVDGSGYQTQNSGYIPSFSQSFTTGTCNSNYAAPGQRVPTVISLKQSHKANLLIDGSHAIPKNVTISLSRARFIAEISVSAIENIPRPMAGGTYCGAYDSKQLKCSQLTVAGKRPLWRGPTDQGDCYTILDLGSELSNRSMDITATSTASGLVNFSVGVSKIGMSYPPKSLDEQIEDILSDTELGNACSRIYNYLNDVSAGRCARDDMFFRALQAQFGDALINACSRAIE